MHTQTVQEKIQGIENAIKRYAEFGIKLWYCSDDANKQIAEIAIKDLQQQLNILKTNNNE